MAHIGSNSREFHPRGCCYYAVITWKKCNYLSRLFCSGNMSGWQPREERQKSPHKISTAFLGHSTVCVYTVYPVQTWTHPSWALKWAPGLWLCLYDSEPKLRKTPFCKTNVAAQLPFGWSTRRLSPFLLRDWAEQVCVIWNMQYKHSLQSFRSVWMTWLLVESQQIFWSFLPQCVNLRKRSKIFANQKTGIMKKCEISRDDDVF